MYENRTYVIFSTLEINLINFEEVLETSSSTIRKSLDESLGIVKWEGQVPNCINNLTTKSQYYNHEEILQELNSIEWNQPYPY